MGPLILGLAVSAAADATEDRALEVVASAAQRRVLRCPSLPVGYGVPLWRRCITGSEGISCLVDRNEGAETVHAGVDEDGFVSLETPTDVLRWWTEDGETSCVREPASPQVFDVRVVDKADNPVKGAVVVGRNAVADKTDRHGVARVTVWSEAPVLLWVATRDALTGPVEVTPNAPVPLLAGSGRRPSRDERHAAAEARYTEAFAAQQADLDAALSNPSLPDDVVGVLKAWQQETGWRWAATAGR